MYVRFQFLTVVNIKSIIIHDISPTNSAVHRRFGDKYCLLLHVRKNTSKKPARSKRHTKRAAGGEPELYRPLRYSQRTNGNRAIFCKGLRRTMIDIRLSTVQAKRDKSSVRSAVANREVPSCRNYVNSDEVNVTYKRNTQFFSQPHKHNGLY